MIDAGKNDIYRILCIWVPWVPTLLTLNSVQTASGEGADVRQDGIRRNMREGMESAGGAPSFGKESFLPREPTFHATQGIKLKSYTFLLQLWTKFKLVSSLYALFWSLQ